MPETIIDRAPLPPFTLGTATQKVRKAENAWHARDPARVALTYTSDSRWRNHRVEAREFFRHHPLTISAGMGAASADHRTFDYWVSRAGARSPAGDANWKTGLATDDIDDARSKDFDTNIVTASQTVNTGA